MHVDKKEKGSPIAAGDTQAELEVRYESLEQLLDECRHCQAGNRYAEALTLIQKHGNEWKDSVPLLGIEAISHRELNNLRESESCYRNILERTSEPPFWANVGHANICELQGNIAESVWYMTAAVKQKYSPELINRLVNLAGKVDGCGEVYYAIARSIDDLCENSESVLNHLCSIGQRAITEGCVDAGCEFFSVAIKKCPDRVTTFRDQLDVLVNSGQIVIARDMVNQWRKDYEDNAPLTGLLATFSFENSDLAVNNDSDISNAITPSLFDPAYYRSQLSKRINSDPYQHYLAHGIGRGMSPSPYFDVEWYKKYRINSTDTVDPLAHFESVGVDRLLDPHPLFHSKWYISEYMQDVELASRPLGHYVTQGWKLGNSPCSLFWSDWYCETYKDGIVSYDPFLDYLVDGWKTKNPNPLFDRRFYLSQVKGDLVTNPLIHYVCVGWRDGLEPHPIFDSTYFLEKIGMSISDLSLSLIHI